MVMLSQAEAAREALRWVTDAAVPVPGGLAWPETRQPDGRVSDDLYDGTAGVLMALAEARLSGIADFDAFAAGAVGRLSYLGGTDPAGDGTPDPGDPALPPPDPRRAELYIGLAGYPVALRAWAAAAGDQAAAATADQTIAWLAGLVAAGQPASELRDLIIGEAGHPAGPRHPGPRARRGPGRGLDRRPAGRGRPVAGRGTGRRPGLDHGRQLRLHHAELLARRGRHRLRAGHRQRPAGPGRTCSAWPPPRAAGWNGSAAARTAR